MQPPRAALVFRMPLSAPTAVLVCHPATPCRALAGVAVRLARGADGRLEGAAQQRLRLPPPQPPARRDGLWRHTCCELFVAEAGAPGYREFNFAPSGEWAAYDFSAYREAAPLPQLPAPRTQLSVEEGAGTLEVRVELAPAALPPAGAALEIGLSLVAEAHDASLAYWALHHPAPRPDFHHRAAFTLSLPAATAPGTA